MLHLMVHSYILIVAPYFGAFQVFHLCLVKNAIIRYMANHNTFKRSFYLNGEMLRLILKSKGMTQQALAKAVGVGRNTIYRAISFNRMESRDDFDKICDLLEIDPIVLLDKDFFSHFCNSQDGTDESEKISTEKINEYLTTYGKGFHRYDIASFNDEYISSFFKGSPGAESLSGEMKAFLFGKIIDSREKFISLLYEFFDSRSEDEDIDDFYKQFEAWFIRNIKNKDLKD